MFLALLVLAIGISIPYLINIHFDVMKGNGYLLDKDEFLVGLYYLLFVSEKS